MLEHCKNCATAFAACIGIAGAFGAIFKIEGTRDQFEVSVITVLRIDQNLGKGHVEDLVNNSYYFAHETPRGLTEREPDNQRNGQYAHNC